MAVAAAARRLRSGGDGPSERFHPNLNDLRRNANVRGSCGDAPGRPPPPTHPPHSPTPRSGRYRARLAKCVRVCTRDETQLKPIPQQNRLWE